MNHRRTTHTLNHARRGFSLLEIMIVIAIMLLLAGFVGFNLLGARDDAKVDTTKLQLNQLRDSLVAFNARIGRFPTEEEGLAVLWSNETLDPEIEATQWRAFTQEPVPTDAWDHEWVYRAESETEGEPFDLFSVGPDGEEGTEDDIYAVSRSGGADGDSGGPVDLGPTGGN